MRAAPVLHSDQDAAALRAEESATAARRRRTEVEGIGFEISKFPSLCSS